MKSGKQRRINFTQEERDDLSKLVGLYSKAITKNGDTKSLKEKAEAWNQIEIKFNLMEGHSIPRTAKQLKKLHENVKSKCRKDLASQKRGVFATGGGVVTSQFREDPNVEIILGLTDIELRAAKDSDRAGLLQPTTPCSDLKSNLTKESVVSVPIAVTPEIQNVGLSTSAFIVSAEDQLFPQSISDTGAVAFENVQLVEEYDVQNTNLVNEARILEEEEIRRLEQDVLQEDGESELAAIDQQCSQLENNDKKSKRVPKRTRKSISEDFIQFRKKLLATEHEWKLAEHNKRMASIANEDAAKIIEQNLRNEALKEKIKGLKAKTLYYENCCNKGIKSNLQRSNSAGCTVSIRLNA